MRQRRANRRGEETTTRTKTPPGPQNEERRGEALPGTSALRKPIFCGRDSGEEEGRPPAETRKKARENSTAVHGGGGVAEVQLKPIYMHILLVKDVAEVDADGN